MLTSLTMPGVDPRGQKKFVSPTRGHPDGANTYSTNKSIACPRMQIRHGGAQRTEIQNVLVFMNVGPPYPPIRNPIRLYSERNLRAVKKYFLVFNIWYGKYMSHMVKLRQKYVMEGASNSFQVLCRLTLTLYQIHGAQFKTINYKLILKEERTLLRATKENTRI